MATNPKYPESDPRHHTANIKDMAIIAITEENNKLFPDRKK